MKENYYQLLGIARSSTTADIRAKYKKLKEQYNSTSSNKNTKKLEEIELAFKTLSNKDLREKYDLSLENVVEVDTSLKATGEESIPFKKAYFLPRVLAFFLDMMIVATAASLLFSIFPQATNLVKLNNQQKEIQNNYLSQKINSEEYLAQSFDLSYDIAYANVIYVIISVALSLGYFVVFQYKKDGQTIGKSLMKIRVVSNNSSQKLTMNHYLVRALIIQSIFLDLLALISVLLMPKSIYGVLSFGLSFMQMIIMIVTIIMVLYRKDGRGIHDMIARTRVVMDGEKEKVLCQS